MLTDYYLTNSLEQSRT